MSLGELAAFVGAHLKKHDIKAVLSGGACVSIYTSNRYESFDLDFIENISTSRKKLKQVLAKIGFIEDARYYKNPDTPFFLEFPPGPLSVGDEPVKKISKVKLSTGEFLLLSPTDCIKDRLAGFYHWKDRQCLEQALLVAEGNKIDMKEIERWSEKEGKAEEYRKIIPDFLKAVKKKKKRPFRPVS
jgi:hypothetical protein